MERLDEEFIERSGTWVYYCLQWEANFLAGKKGDVSFSLFRCPVEIDAPSAFDRVPEHRQYMTLADKFNLHIPQDWQAVCIYINAGQSWGLSYTVSVGDWSPLISPWTLVRDWLPRREFPLPCFYWRLKNPPLCRHSLYQFISIYNFIAAGRVEVYLFSHYPPTDTV